MYTWHRLATDCCSELKIVLKQKRIAAKQYNRIQYTVNVRKIYSTVERMLGCKYTVKMIKVLLKEHIGTISFEKKHVAAERITKIHSKIFHEIKTVSLKESIIATLKIDTLLQSINDCK